MNSKQKNQQPLRVTVFGGSHPQQGEFAYEQALELGKLIGSAGYTVLTGGYMGTMEAVSRGVAESGGHVIGVTCDEIEAWRPKKPNPWVQEELRFPSLRQRLYALIEKCDAAIALPGGVGTLAEIAIMWSQMQVFATSPRPLILIGEGWQTMMSDFFATLGDYVPERTRSLITFAPDVETAFLVLQSSHSTLHTPRSTR
jgi:uncharacterized protein (TIGR00730 family)